MTDAMLGGAPQIEPKDDKRINVLRNVLAPGKSYSIFIRKFTHAVFLLMPLDTNSGTISK